MHLLETVEIIFLNLIVTFWNCCFALFKSSLRSTEQSRYLRACKIHGAKRGSRDRRFTDFGVAICSCRPIEVIAVHAVNSGPNNPDYSRSSSFLHFLSFSLSLFPPSFCRLPLLSLFFFETRQTRVAISRPRKDSQLPPSMCYEGRLYERRARRQPYIPTVHLGRIPDVNTYNRRKVQTSVPRPSIRSFCRELPC